MRNLNNKAVLDMEIKMVKGELENAKGLFTRAVLEEQLDYLESKKPAL